MSGVDPLVLLDELATIFSNGTRDPRINSFIKSLASEQSETYGVASLALNVFGYTIDSPSQFWPFVVLILYLMNTLSALTMHYTVVQAVKQTSIMAKVYTRNATLIVGIITSFIGIMLGSNLLLWVFAFMPGTLLPSLAYTYLLKAQVENARMKVIGTKPRKNAPDIERSVVSDDLRLPIHHVDSRVNRLLVLMLFIPIAVPVVVTIVYWIDARRAERVTRSHSYEMVSESP